MNDKALVERLRMTGKRISVPCPDGIDGCLVHHFRIETDPLCEEAATRIEALEAALRETMSRCTDCGGRGSFVKHDDVTDRDLWESCASCAVGYAALESKP